MCGIFFVQSKNGLENVHEDGMKGVLDNFYSFQSRGPDRSKHKRQLLNEEKSTERFIGFHRLAINGISEEGDQPITLQDAENEVNMICNGEIYNYKQLAEEYDISLSEGCSDCAIIPSLFLKIGIVETISKLDGVFAFVLTHSDKIYIGRDAIGVRPLFIRKDSLNLVVSSIAKGCEGFKIEGETQQVSPGTLTVFNESNTLGQNFSQTKWWKLSNPHLNSIQINPTSEVRKLLIEATEKRLMSERPVGCLLSGGLDSSVIAAILAKRVENLKTFSIGFSSDSTDLKYARLVANHLNTDHSEIIIPYEKALSAIPEVIKATETTDITTIRASVGMYLLSEWIKQNTDITVLYSGEGSDELFCGYLYFHNAPDNKTLEQESKRLVNELHLYDVLRADRTTAVHGLELRVPFLDKKVVQFAMSLVGEVRTPKNVKNMEKIFLRQAFSDMLPEKVVWRRKEGFSDGVSNLEKPWYKHIQESLPEEKEVSDVRKEEKFYRQIFDENFKDIRNPVPKNWMPKWTNTDDPSGRVIEAFDES